MNKKNKDSALVVVQRNDLVNAHIPMSSQMLDVYYYAIARTDTRDKEFKEIVISYNDFTKLISKNGRSYSKNELANILYENSATSIVIKDNKEMKFIPLWQKLVLNTDNNQISLLFNTELKPMLLNIDGNFTKINTSVLFNSTSKYAKRMKVLMFKYINQYKTSFEMEVMEFKQVMALVDFNKNKQDYDKKTEKYKVVANLRNRVLDPMCNDINSDEGMDYTITYDLIKNGLNGKLSKIKFNMNKKEKVEVILDKEELRFLKAIVQVIANGRWCNYLTQMEQLYKEYKNKIKTQILRDSLIISLMYADENPIEYLQRVVFKKLPPNLTQINEDWENEYRREYKKTIELIMLGENDSNEMKIYNELDEIVKLQIKIEAIQKLPPNLRKLPETSQRRVFQINENIIEIVKEKNFVIDITPK